MRYLPPVVLWATLVPATLAGQSAAPAVASSTNSPNVEVDPIRCWWRTSAGAVRVGEPFTVVLTCAVLQTPEVQVRPDETRLDASVIQMAPFEVIGGSHPADLYRTNRRFFQYDYRLRIINPDVIGKDVGLPDPQIHYRVNSTVAANTALQGRDHAYLLPPQSVRVLSLVPANAPDIRDSAQEGFGAAEQLGFRASVVQIAAVTAMAIGALIATLVVVRVVVRTRQDRPAGTRGLNPLAVLRAAARELAAVQRDAAGQGWGDALVARALSATRIIAASAVGRQIQQQQDVAIQAGDGRLSAAGWRQRTSTAVSGAATPDDLARALETLPVATPVPRRQLLEDLHRALTAFTAVQYARDAAYDGDALDAALTAAIVAARQVQSAHTWPNAYFRRLAPRVQAQQQA